MLQHLKWRSLEDRGRDARLVMMYKISHNKVAVSESDRFSPPLRHALSIISGPTMQNTTKKGFFSPRTIVDWNRLPQTSILTRVIQDCHYHISSLNSLSALYIFFSLFSYCTFSPFSSSLFASQLNDIIFKLLKQVIIWQKQKQKKATTKNLQFYFDLSKKTNYQCFR